MTETTLWARRQVVAPHWQLGDMSTVDPDRTWLVGWDAQPDEDGVPTAVGLAIARALADTVRVSFLRAVSRSALTTEWAVGDEGDFTRTTRPAGTLGTAIDRLRGRQGPAALVCSQRADAIADMFGEPAFPWWLQSQVLLLSSLDTPPPDVTTEQALALLDVDWAERAAALQRCGVLAVRGPLWMAMRWGCWCSTAPSPNAWWLRSPHRPAQPGSTGRAPYRSDSAPTCQRGCTTPVRGRAPLGKRTRESLALASGGCAGVAATCQPS